MLFLRVLRIGDACEIDVFGHRRFKDVIYLLI